MTKDVRDPRAQAAKLVREALGLNFRHKDARPLLEEALMALEGAAGPSELFDTSLRGLKVGAKIVDPGAPGLLMRYGKRTGKRWFYRFNHPETGKQTELSFGRYAEPGKTKPADAGLPWLGLAEARERCAELRAQRADGLVPQLPGEGETVAEPTVGELVDRYLVEYAGKVKRPTSEREDARLLKRHVTGTYGDLRASELTPEKLRAMLVLLHRSAPREAEKVRAVLSTLFNVASGRSRKIAMDRPWLPPDFRNPLETVQLPSRKAKSHSPSQAELRSYLRGLGELGRYGEALRLQIETFARVGEVAGLAWAELDLEAGVWTLPADRAKNGLAHKVMLARQTVDRLRGWTAVSESEWVFPSATNPARPVGVALLQHAIGDNRDRLGVADGFTSHSTRHAALTWIAENGGGRDIRDRLSNHKPPTDGADHIYNAAQLNTPAREWTQRWVDHLCGLDAQNVFQLGEIRA